MKIQPSRRDRFTFAGSHPQLKLQTIVEMSLRDTNYRQRLGRLRYDLAG
jgi:hypothetical protein